MPPDERFTVIHERLQERRAEVHGGGPMATVAAVANLLPTWMVTGLIRNQASHIDFATSNLPGFLGDTWVAEARTLHTYAPGPCRRDRLQHHPGVHRRSPRHRRPP